MRRRLLLVAGICAFTWSLHAAQFAATDPQLPPSKPGTATIIGHVVDATTGDPVPGALVSATMAAVDDGTEGAASTATQRRVVASASGRFVFTRAASGPIRLTVSASGYLPGGYGDGSLAGPSRTLVLADGQRTEPITIRLRKPAVMEGRLVDEAGEPLVRVSIRALRRGWMNGKPRFGGNNTASTDDRGMFRFSDLIPGDWVLVMPASYQTTPQSVRDEYRRLSGLGGQAALGLSRSLQSSGAPSASMAGDRMGAFVVQHPAGLEGLRPADDGGLLGYGPAYFPALGADGLEVVRLQAGEERAGIEMRALPSRVVSVSGVVIGPDGPAAMVGVRLTPVALAGAFPEATFETARASTDVNGAFTFIGVAAGEYHLNVERIPRPELGGATTMISGPGGTIVTSLSPGGAPDAPTEPTLTAASRISVGDRDLAGLSVTLAAGPRVSGSAEFSGTSTPPTAEQLQRVSVTLRPIDRSIIPGITSARLDAQGRFTTMGYPPGRYVVTATSPGSGWLMHSVMQGGKDVSLEPLVLDSANVSGLVITFSDRRTELSGAVIPAVGSETDALLIAFPSDLRTWVRNGMNTRQMRISRPGSDGRYVLAALPAGSYHVAAVPIDLDLALTPEFFEGLASSAATVVLADGEKRGLDLRLPPSREPDALPDESERASGPYVPDVEDAQQQPPTRDVVTMAVGTGSISGVVRLDDEARTPVRRARVRLTGSAGTVTLVTATDDQGRFTFRDLPPVRYNLVAERPGLVSGTYGAARPGAQVGAPLALAEGQQLTGVSITMGRGAVITGRIVDEFGRPVERAEVMLMQPQTGANGQRVLRQTFGAFIGLNATDDRGLYRIYGLPAGEYVVGALSRAAGTDLRRVTAAELEWADQPSTNPPPTEGPVVGSTPIYYPGTADVATATFLRLNAGEERGGIDFAISYVRTARASGRVEMPDGSVPRSITMNFFSDDAVTWLGAPLFARVNPDGTFSTASVPPGRYSLTARAAPTPDPTVPQGASPGGRRAVALSLWATHDVVISGEDVTGLVVTLAPGSKITGKVTFDATTAQVPADLRGLSVRVFPVASGGVTVGVPAAPLDADGTFTLEGVVPGAYNVSVILPVRTGSLPTWTTRHIMHDGRDIADHGLVVKPGADVSGVEAVLTDRVTEVSGTVVDAQGTPVTDFTVIVLPVDRSLWTLGARRRPAPQRPDTTGRFRMIDLVAGEYYLAVVTEFEPGQHNDTAFLESLLPSAIKFTLSEGERKVQNVKLAGG